MSKGNTFANDFLKLIFNATAIADLAENDTTSPAVGKATSGAGQILYSGTVTPNISISNGVTPRLTTASTVTED